jgi:hypothetical protein
MRLTTALQLISLAFLAFGCSERAQEKLDASIETLDEFGRQGHPGRDNNTRRRIPE